MSYPVSWHLPGLTVEKDHTTTTTTTTNVTPNLTSQRRDNQLADVFFQHAGRQRGGATRGDDPACCIHLFRGNQPPAGPEVLCLLAIDSSHAHAHGWPVVWTVLPVGTEGPRSSLSWPGAVVENYSNPEPLDVPLLAVMRHSPAVTRPTLHMHDNRDRRFGGVRGAVMWRANTGPMDGACVSRWRGGFSGRHQSSAQTTAIWSGPRSNHHHRDTKVNHIPTPPQSITHPPALKPEPTMHAQNPPPPLRHHPEHRPRDRPLQRVPLARPRRAEGRTPASRAAVAVQRRHGEEAQVRTRLESAQQRPEEEEEDVLIL